MSYAFGVVVSNVGGFRHKIDFYKEDSCHSTGAEGGAFGQYGRMRDALNATVYPIWFALCGWLPEYAVPPLGGNAIGNSARIGPDTGAAFICDIA